MLRSLELGTPVAVPRSLVADTLAAAVALVLAEDILVVVPHMVAVLVIVSPTSFVFSFRLKNSDFAKRTN